MREAYDALLRLNVAVLCGTAQFEEEVRVLGLDEALCLSLLGEAVLHDLL